MPTADDLNAVLARARAAAEVPPAPPPAAAPQDPIGDVLAAEVPQAAPMPPGAPPAEELAGPADGTVAATGAPAAVEGLPQDAPATPPAARAAAKALPVTVDLSQILSAAGTLAVHEAVTAVLRASGGPTFKVAALQSGYAVEMGAINFEEVARIQASALDAHAARMKLLRVVHGRMSELSCGPITFANWLKVTAQGDYDTLMYGLYAATYPGDNEFDVGCRHCRHENKIRCDVGALARIEGGGVTEEIKRLLDPKTGHRGAITDSLVGRRVQRQLPVSGMVAEITNPSLQDYLDGVQWFVAAQDKATGELPPAQAGAETIRTLVMYVPRVLVPTRGGRTYMEVKGAQAVASLIGRLSRVDGSALVDAVDDAVKELNVSYQLPAFNCGGCGKRNDDMALDFEALLFFKLRERT